MHGGLFVNGDAGSNTPGQLTPATLYPPPYSPYGYGMHTSRHNAVPAPAPPTHARRGSGSAHTPSIVPVPELGAATPFVPSHNRYGSSGIVPVPEPTDAAAPSYPRRPSFNTQRPVIPPLLDQANPDIVIPGPQRVRRVSFSNSPPTMAPAPSSHSPAARRGSVSNGHTPANGPIPLSPDVTRFSSTRRPSFNAQTPRVTAGLELQNVPTPSQGHRPSYNPPTPRAVPIPAPIDTSLTPRVGFASMPSPVTPRARRGSFSLPMSSPGLPNIVPVPAPTPTSPTEAQVNPTLQPPAYLAAAATPLIFDVATEKYSATIAPPSQYNSTPPNRHFLDEAAFHPAPAAPVTIHFPKTPWPLTLSISPGNPLTAHRLLHAIWMKLNKPVTNRVIADFPSDIQASAGTATRARCAADPEAAAMGAFRHDFLGGRTRFAGLRPRTGFPGEWDALFVHP